MEEVVEAMSLASDLLLLTLHDLIAREAELLLGVEEKVEWIKTEFSLMLYHFQSMEAMHQLPRKASDCIEATRTVLSSTEDAITTYTKKATERKMAPTYKKVFYWLQVRDQSKKLERIRYEIVKVRQGWRCVDFASLDQDFSQDSVSAAAMAKLEDAVCRNRDWNFIGKQLMECVQWVRDELAPLHVFLQETNLPGLELGKRQKLWIQELTGIFQFVSESFTSFQGDRVQGTNIRIAWILISEVMFSKIISKIQKKIIDLCRRYCTYGIGEIQANNGLSSIFPRIRMSHPVPRASKSFMEYVKFRLRRQTRASTKSSSRLMHREWNMKPLRVELELMKALLEDGTTMSESDQRISVWLNQIKEISVDLEALDERYTSIWHRMGKGVARMTKHYRMKQIGNEIEQITARKLRYGIGSTMGERELLYFITADTSGKAFIKLSPKTAASLIQTIPRVLYNSLYITKHNLRNKLKSVERELQLSQALLKDVKKMETLEVRLQFWLEEIQGVAYEANAILEHTPTTPYARFRARRRMNNLNIRLSIMSKWKRTYDIRYVKSPQSSIPVNNGLEETGLYPPKTTEKNIDLFRREIKLMRAMGIDFKEMDVVDETAKVWVEEMLHIAEDAENFLFEYDKEQIIWFLHPMLEKDFDGIQDRIRELSDRRVAYGIELGKKLPPHSVSEIKAKLLKDHEHPCILPILLMGRKHKEALHEFINNDNVITKHFTWHAWVHIPNELSATFILRDIVLQITRQHGVEFLEEETTTTMNARENEDEVIQRLLEMLMHERYIIILDEILTTDVWRVMEQVFGRISTQSRIIALGNEHVWNCLDSSSRAVFDIPVQLTSFSRGITQNLMPFTGGIDTVFQSVPSYLKQCIYYFSLFPVNFQIPVRRLIVLWVAEGLVRQRRNRHESVEQLAEHYLTELIDLKLVQVTQRKRNGKIKACQLSDESRDALLAKAEEGRFFKDATGNISRLVDHHGTSTNSSFIQIHGNSSSSTLAPNYRNVCSFLAFDTKEGSKPGEDIGKFLHKCISTRSFLLLKTLDLERVFRPKLPKAVSKLINLRYLGLRWTYLEKLPGSINKLLNLQVLDVKHTYISILPRSIWSMQYLRHLYLSEIYRTRFANRPSHVSLTYLRTLWGAFIDENTLVKQGLDTLLNIRKLGLSCRSISSKRSLMAEQLEAVNDWISNLIYLESLRLKSRDEHGNPSDLHLKPLTGNQELSTVYLLGKLRPSVVSTFPRNLVDITLSGSQLVEDPMPSLEKIPNLLILRLLSQSVVCDGMHISSTGFPRLKVLNLWMLENLKECDAERGAMPCLEDMEIRACLNLNMLPQALQNVDTLQIFKLTGLSEGFMDEIKVKQAELWAHIKPVLQVEPVVQAQQPI